MDPLVAMLIEDMKAVFGDDRRRIDHALAVLGCANHIRSSEGGDPLVIQAAAVLHDIGIPEAERKYHSAAGRYQEIEGPPIAREILARRGVPPDVIEHVCKIIANHHSGKDIDAIEFRTLWDADWLVNLPEDFPDAHQEKLRRIIGKVFKTDSGRESAVQSFLKG